MFNDKQERPARRPGARTAIGCTAALAILATTVLTGQAAQASIVTVGGSAPVTGLVSTVTTTAPIVTPIIGTGTGGSTTGSGSGVSVGNGGSTGTGVSVGIGIGVGAGSGTTPVASPSTPTTTPPDTTGVGGTTTGVDGSMPTDGSSTSTGGVTVGASTSATKAPTKARVTIKSTTTVVYPNKDGYRDTVRFTVASFRPAGAVGAVTGKATLTKGKTVVKTWKITKTTRALEWNGMVGKSLKAGKYVLHVTLRSGGKVTKATRTIKVSGATLHTATKRISTRLTGDTTHNTMPAAVRRAFSKGKVFVQVTTVVERISGKARLGFVNGVKSVYVPLVLGTFTSPKLPVPNTKEFRTVTFKHDWKPGSVKLKAIRIDWIYKVLR